MQKVSSIISLLILSAIFCATAASLPFKHAFAVDSALVETPRTSVRLITKTASWDGNPLQAGFLFDLKPGWHIYFKNAGDSGIPPKLARPDSEEYSFGPLQFAPPKKIPVGTLVNFGYEGQVLLPFSVSREAPPATDTTVLSAKLSWLICQEDCIPESGEFLLEIANDSEISASPDSHHFKSFEDAFSRNLELASSPEIALTTTGELQLTLRSDKAAFENLLNAYFFPYNVDLIAPAEEQSLEFDAQQLRLSITPGSTFSELSNSEKGIVKLDFNDGQTTYHPIEAVRSSALDLNAQAGSSSSLTPSEVGSFKLPIGIALGLLGGLLLNLMPCVFPVISLKILGFAKKAHEDPKLIRLHGLAFFAGVVLSMSVLALVLVALKVSGEAIGWGFHLQSPVFVSFMALLFFTLALTFFGFFTIDSRFTSSLGERVHAKGLMSSFFNGTLATAVATPCTGPLMAQALGLAITLRPFEMFLIFVSIGLGMGFPYLVLAFYPSLLKRLPKPGKWMETFEQVLAFPLLIFCVYLLWVLAAQAGTDGVIAVLSACLSLFLGIWFLQRFSLLLTKVFGVSAIALSLLLVVSVSPIEIEADTLASADVGEGKWLEFKPGLAEELAANGQVVYVDFTATWCITCQWNKKRVFSSDSVNQYIKENNVALIRADWTNQDASIANELQRFGRAGVPLNVVYSLRRGSEPEVLPSLLSPGIVLEALKRASSPAP